MNADTAARLIPKLRALASDPHAYSGERQAAAAKAASLEARFGTPPPRRASSPPRRARPAPAAGFAHWAAPAPSSGWTFDVQTGEGENVKVRSYRDRANWRIEIPL